VRFDTDHSYLSIFSDSGVWQGN